MICVLIYFPYTLSTHYFFIRTFRTYDHPDPENLISLSIVLPYIFLNFHMIEYRINFPEYTILSTQHYVITF